MNSSLEKKNVPDLKTVDKSRAIELAKQFIKLRMRPDCRPITKGAFCQQVFLSQKNLNIALKMIQDEGLMDSGEVPKSSKKEELVSVTVPIEKKKKTVKDYNEIIKSIREKRIMEGLGALSSEEKRMLDEYDSKKSNE